MSPPGLVASLTVTRRVIFRNSLGFWVQHDLKRPSLPSAAIQLSISFSFRSAVHIIHLRLRGIKYHEINCRWVHLSYLAINPNKSFIPDHYVFPDASLCRISQHPQKTQHFRNSTMSLMWLNSWRLFDYTCISKASHLWLSLITVQMWYIKEVLIALSETSMSSIDAKAEVRQVALHASMIPQNLDIGLK